MIRFRAPQVTLFAALIGMPASMAAQIVSTADNTGYGTTAAEFLLLGATARGMALGGFYSAIATDIGGLNANPGATALMKRPGVQGSQLQWVGDTKLNWGAVAMPYGGGSSVIGFQIGSFGFSDQPVYTPQQVRRHRRLLLGVRAVCRHDHGQELLRPLLGRCDGQGQSSTSWATSVAAPSPSTSAPTSTRSWPASRSALPSR